MTRGSKLKTENAILCEDIRREEGTGKGMLIGVFSGDIIVPELPGNVQLAIYLEVKASPGEHTAQLRLSGPQKGKGMHATLAAVFDGGDTGGNAVIATPKFGILMQSEGVFKVEGQVDGGPWSTLISKKVILRPSA